jgi:hypothetical protein
MTETSRRPSLALRKLELFRQLGYQPHPAQLLVHRSKAKRRVVACGTRFGKSTIGVHEAIAALLEPREAARGWLIAPTYELTKRIAERVVATLQAHFPHRILSIDTRERSITVANLGGGESVLRARSADRPVSLLGESLDFAILDEAAKLRPDVWSEHVAPRLLDRNGWSLLLSTPEGPGWFKDEFKRAKTDAAYESWQFPTSANPKMSADLIEAERGRLDPQIFKAQYLGEFIGSDLDPCDTCGGPDLLAKCVIILRDDAEPLHCAECGGYVHEDGSTAVPLWGNRRGETTLIVLRPECPNPPPLP